MKPIVLSDTTVHETVGHDFHFNIDKSDVIRTRARSVVYCGRCWAPIQDDAKAIENHEWLRHLGRGTCYLTSTFGVR